MRQDQQKRAKEIMASIAQVRAELHRLEIEEPTNDFRRIELLRLIDILKSDAVLILNEVMQNPEINVKAA